MTSLSRTKTALAIGAALTVTPIAPVSVQAQDGLKSLHLSSEGLSGAAAVSALGKNLAAVAAHYGKPAKELRRLLLADKSLRVARNGRLYYAEEASQIPRGAAPEDTILSGTLLPLDQTFTLHSRPGSNRLLILNFQGKTVTGTYWNTSQGRASIVARPFTLDGNASTFSDAERTMIQQIWQRVAEDYAPFDVDVTTDIGAASTAPAGSQSAMVVITRQQDYGVAAPGVAFVSTFGNATYDPAFVAFDTLGYNAKYIAEAISHELGHRLGLDHDGTRTSAYYSGQGTAPMKWAPIMGNSYAANVTQFSKGEYRNANNLQDDFNLMTRYLSLRTDVGGSTAAKAATFPASTAGGRSTGSINGVIETQGDVDLFAIVAGAGSLSASATPSALGPDAPLSISLLNDTGGVVASSGSTGGLSGALTANITRPGTYYLKVSATGYGSAASTGFSDYGSRGLYKLTASYPDARRSPPVAAITAAPAAGLAPLTVAFTGSGSGGSGRISAYAWNFGNGSTADISAPRATFSQPGTYTAELKVTDTAGFSGAAARQIVVGKAFTASTLSVTRVINPDGTFSATANINSFADSAGRRLMPTAVYGTWSGAAQGPAQSSRFTRSGMTLSSPTSTSASGCFTFTLDRIDAADPATSAQAPVAWFTATPRTATACAQQAAR